MGRHRSTKSCAGKITRRPGGWAQSAPKLAVCETRSSSECPIFSTSRPNLLGVLITDVVKLHIKFGKKVAKCEIVSQLPVGVACDLTMIYPVAFNDDSK